MNKKITICLLLNELLWNLLIKEKFAIQLENYHLLFSTQLIIFLDCCWLIMENWPDLNWIKRLLFVYYWMNCCGTYLSKKNLLYNWRIIIFLFNSTHYILDCCWQIMENRPDLNWIKRLIVIINQIVSEKLTHLLTGFPALILGYFCSQAIRHIEWLRTNSMRLCHPPDGSTSTKYKLLCFKPS